MRKTIFIILISLFYVLAGCTTVKETVKKKDKRIIIIDDDVVEFVEVEKEGRQTLQFTAPENKE